MVSNSSIVDIISVVVCTLTSIQCYYIGATDIAATMLIREVTRPLSFSKPVEKICEELKKKDSQICELRYGEWFAIEINLSHSQAFPPSSF